LLITVKAPEVIKTVVEPLISNNEVNEEDAILQKRREFAEKMAGGKAKSKPVLAEKT